MKEGTFRILLCSLVGLGILGTLAHFAYALYAYQHCSIIYFIGRELWG